MKVTNKPLSWADYLDNEEVYAPDNKFCKAYANIMRYVIYKTNLQTAMLYYVLYSHRDQYGRCFPSIKTLAIECSVSEKTISKMLKELKEAGAIKIKPGKQGRCNSYSFPIETYGIPEEEKYKDEQEPEEEIVQPKVNKILWTPEAKQKLYDDYNSGKLSMPSKPETEDNEDDCYLDYEDNL